MNLNPSPRQRGDVVPYNTGTFPPGRAVIAPGAPDTDTEGIDEATDTEGLYENPLDGSALGLQPTGTSFALLGAAALVGFFLLRKKKVTRRRTNRKRSR